MKKIEAIIRLSRFDMIREALAKIDVRFFTLNEVKGFGLQKKESLSYRGSSYNADYIARLQLDIICGDEKVDEILEAVLSAGQTGEIGDGKIVVYDLEKVVRIRNGELNKHAI